MSSLLIRAGMQLARLQHWRAVEGLAHDPASVQTRVLRTLMERNKDTRFGREHGFASVKSHADYHERVPVQEYETLRPYVEEQRTSGAPALTAEPPIFYAQTSGTTAAPKYIPVTQSMLKGHAADQRLFSFLQHRACPSAFEGRFLGIVSPAVEGHLDSGHPVGSVSGHIYETLPASLRARYVIPPEVSRVADYELRYLILVRLALAEPNITWTSTANPSTFLRIDDVLQANREILLDSLRTGSLPGLENVDPALRRTIEPRLHADPARASRLARESELTFANVWPRLRLVTTWTGGNCGIALARVRKKLPPGAVVMELGYLSSEFRGTIPLEAESPGGLPPMHHHYFEFVEQKAWDGGAPEFLRLDQLELHGRYYVLVTTAAGLYRYFMNDLLEVTSFLHRTPLLRFLQKGRGVTSLTGEKLYEMQAIQAVRDATARCGLSPRFFLMIADEDRSTYRLFLELGEVAPPDQGALAAAVDQRLGELNIEYRGKRASGRLGPLTVSWLRSGASEAYKAACVKGGQREGQFKPAVLQYQKELTFPIDAHVIQ